MQAQSGMYAGKYLQGAAILSQYKLTTTQIQQLQPAMADLIAFNKEIGKGAESVTTAYEAVGEAIFSGVPKGLKNIGIELTVQQQQWLKINATMGRYSANLAMIYREIERQHPGEAGKYLTTLAGQTEGLQAAVEGTTELIGEAITPLEYKLVSLLKSVVDKFSPGNYQGG